MAHIGSEEIRKKYNHKAVGEIAREKGDIWEGGHRVPFMPVWLNKIPNS